MRSSATASFSENREVVVPSDLCKHRLHKYLVRLRLGERPHVFQVAGRESLHIGEGSLEVGARRSLTLALQLSPFLSSRFEIIPIPWPGCSGTAGKDPRLATDHPWSASREERVSRTADFRSAGSASPIDGMSRPCAPVE